MRLQVRSLFPGDVWLVRQYRIALLVRVFSVEVRFVRGILRCPFRYRVVL